MEKRVLALRDMIKKQIMENETLDPRNWMKDENLKGFADFMKNKHMEKDFDNSYDNKLMLLDAEKQFMDAAKRNDVETMRSVGRGLNPNAKNLHNRTALHYAAAGKNKEAVQLLLQRRVKVDQQDKYGVAPIHLAAWFGSLDILKLLVKAGAEQKIENEDGLNIMHCAAMNNHTEIVEYIIDDLQMKELDKEDQLGNRAFALAAQNGCNDMLEMLMNPYEMATMEPNKRGETPLHLAAKNGHTDTVHLLLLSFDIRDEVNMEGKTALYQAADNGHEQCMVTLMEAGCDPNILTTTNCTALHPVAERGDNCLVQTLLNYKANTDFQNQHLETPLHLAVKNSHIPVIHSLLQAGCDINLTNKRSQTVLHLAAEEARIEVVDMLLKNGIDLTIRDKQGKTALGVAARADEVIIVDMIIKAERYYSWREDNPESNELIHTERPFTFKLDHRNDTRQLRATAWQLAYELLKPKDWRKLAEHWNFTTEQIDAIKEQWTGQQSYREHGNRMLLIWLHGEDLAQSSPLKELYNALIATGHRRAADKIRMDKQHFTQSCNIS